jgi:hypothetical protein
LKGIKKKVTIRTLLNFDKFKASL